MMRVLFVCGGNNPDFETAPFIVGQAESLQKIGVEVGFYTIKGRGLTGYLRHIRPLRRTIKNGNYDLVHAHYTFSGWVARLASCRMPLVVSYMGSDFAGLYRSDGRRKAISLILILQGMLLNIFTSHIIVKSKQQLRMLPLKCRAEVIPNGVDFEAFRPVNMTEARRNLGLQQSENKLILFLGNPDDPRKNFSLAKEIYELVKKEIEAILIVPYPVAPEKVWLYLNAADVLLFTSFFEGSSNLLKEAMACNCPVVTTPAGDAADIVTGVDQCHLSGYDPEETAGKVLEVLRSGKRSDGRQRIEHLKDSIVAERIVSKYNKAMKRRKEH